MNIALTILEELRTIWPKCGHSRRYAIRCGRNSKYTQCSICKSERAKQKRRAKLA